MCVCVDKLEYLLNSIRTTYTVEYENRCRVYMEIK